MKNLCIAVSFVLFVIAALIALIADRDVTVACILGGVAFFVLSHASFGIVIHR